MTIRAPERRREGRFMQMQLASIAIAVAVVCPRPAIADALEPIREVVQARYDHGAVVLDVETRFRNGGLEAIELSQNVELPAKATVTHLEMLRDGRWQKAEVMETENASKAYQQSIEEGRDTRRMGPLLVEWGGQGDFSMTMWPLPAGSTLAVRYRVKVYPCVYAGHYAIQIPLAKSGTVHGGKRVATGSKLSKELAENCENIEMSANPVIAFAAPRWGLHASWASLPLPTRAISDLRVVVGQLSKQPVGAHVVFVIDASYSQDKDGIERQLARVRDFAAELPSGRYQLVAYRRYAHPVLMDWTPGRDLARALDQLPARMLATGNGSRLDRGLAVALSLLDGTRGPRRVVAFTDELLAGGSMPLSFQAALARSAPAGTIVHLVRPSGGGHERVWGGEFAALAEVLGGIYAVVDSETSPVHRSMTQLVRPQVIERVQLRRVDGQDEDDFPSLDELREGQGVAQLFALLEPSSGVVIEGYLWNRKISERAFSSAAAARHLGAFAIADDWLRDVEGKTLALAEGLLSKWTSMIALPRRPVGPQNVGISGFGVGGFGSSSCCSGCRMGVGRAHIAEQVQLALEAPVRGCMARHGQSAVKLSVETTAGSEIVSVRALDAASSNASPLAECIAEATWELRASGGGKSTQVTHFAIEPGPKIRTTGGTVAASRSAW